MQTSTSPNTQLNDPHLNTSAERPSTRQGWLPVVVTCVAIAVLAVIGSRLLGVSWLKILTIGGLMVVGIFAGFYKQVGEWLDKGLNYYLIFLVWMLFAFGPSVGAMYLNRRIVTLPRTFQVVIFLLWGLLLAYLVWLVATERRRLRLFQRLEPIGRFTPVAYSFNLLMIAIVFFSSVTYVVAKDRIRRVQPTDTTPITAESVQDLYLWHFLEAVPLLKVNDTIPWKKPFNYEGHLVGWILLLFKLAVIIPVIATFASYWRNFGVSKSAALTGRQWPRTARSAGRYTRRAGGSIYYRRTARGCARSNH